MAGYCRVRLEVIGAPIDVPAGDFYEVQVGAFSNFENAERLRARYAARFGVAQLAVKQGRAPLYRVLVGKTPSPAAAEQIAAQLRTEVGQVYVVRLDSSTGPSSPVQTNAVFPDTAPSNDSPAPAGGQQPQSSGQSLPPSM